MLLLKERVESDGNTKDLADLINDGLGVVIAVMVTILILILMIQITSSIAYDWAGTMVSCSMSCRQGEEKAADQCNDEDGSIGEYLFDLHVGIE